MATTLLHRLLKSAQRFLMLLLPAAILWPCLLQAQGNVCYQATIDKKTITYKGDVWRQILNQAAHRRVASNREPLDPLPANQKPSPKIKKCLGATDALLVNAPDLYYQDPNIGRNDAKYFGAVTSAGMFRKLAEMQCGTTASYPYQFFMIGKNRHVSLLRRRRGQRVHLFLGMGRQE